MIEMLATILFLAVSRQSTPVGSLPISGFAITLEQIGFDRPKIDERGGTVALLFKGTPISGWVNISAPNDGSLPTVTKLFATNWFYLRRMLPRRELADWLKREKAGEVQASSFLDGAVSFSESIFSDPQQTEDEVRRRVKDLIRVQQDFAAAYPEVQPLTTNIAPTKLDLSTRLDSIDHRDASVLITKFGWEPKFGYGTSGGWATGATINGSDYFLREVGGEPGGLRFAVMFRWVGKADEMTSWSRAHKTLAWATVTDYDGGGMVDITHVVDLSKGPTVGEVREEILRFDRALHDIGLPAGHGFGGH
jgi:hypothetical protein